MACHCLRIRMDRLDSIVIDEVVEQVLQPDRLQALLDSYLRFDSDRSDQNRNRVARMRQDQQEVEAAISDCLGSSKRDLWTQTIQACARGWLA